jgi:hypothetical protein
MCLICLQFNKMSFPEQVFALDETAASVGYDHAKEVMKLICNTELEKLDTDPEHGTNKTAREELEDTLAIDMLSRMVYSTRSPKKIYDGNCEGCAQVREYDKVLSQAHDKVYVGVDLAVDTVKDMAKKVERSDCIPSPGFDWDQALKSWDEPDDHPVSEADQAELDKVLESQLKMPC